MIKLNYEPDIVLQIVLRKKIPLLIITLKPLIWIRTKTWTETCSTSLITLENVVVEKLSSDLLWWIWCSRLLCSRSIIFNVIIIIALLFLRGLAPPRAGQAQQPVQVRRHDGNGITFDPIFGDVLWQEVVLTY